MNSLSTGVDGAGVGSSASFREADDADASKRPRVLAWSGPGGWRDSRPLLVPRALVCPPDADAGFSLIELMVVLLVLGILTAIAVPTFLGTKNAADDRSAQSNLVTAFTDARAQFQKGQTYDVQGLPSAALLATNLENDQLDMTFKAGTLGPNYTTGGSSSSASDISVGVSPDGSGVVLAAYSVPGNCFYIVDNSADLGSLVAPPYAGATLTPVAHAVSGPLGLPTKAGTSYVSVSGDVDKSDCNASTPTASGAGATADLQNAGFPGVTDP